MLNYLRWWLRRRRLERQVRSAMRDTRPWVVLAGLTPAERVNKIANWRKYRINLGECTYEERDRMLFGK